MRSESTVDARVTRRFGAPPERVFDAWLEPDKVREWFGPGLGEMVRVEIDPQVGGSFAFVQQRDGGDVEHLGEYLEVDRPRRLAFTWAVADEDDSDRVVIDIAPLDEGCELTLTHELHPDWADYASRTRNAWSGMLDEIAALLR